MLRIVSVSALTALAAVAIAIPATAGAAPNRPALDPQVEMGPTLHPSGNDRTVENGKSGTQGWAMHDPDGDYNYGVDQNGDLGGLYTGDQDGNNGCGNDQDFEDDNNGLCGGNKRTTDCVDSTAPGSANSLLHRNDNSLPELDDTCEPPCEGDVTCEPPCEWSCPSDDTSTESTFATFEFDFSSLL